MKKQIQLKPLLPAVLVSLLITGCTTSPTSHLYLLKAQEITAINTAYYEHLAGASISIEPIRIPGHLDRPVILTQVNDEELAYSEFHRWGESLSDNLVDVIVRDMGAQLSGSIVWNDRAMSEIPADFRIRIQVLSLTGKLGETATLNARWSILSGKSFELLRTKISIHQLDLVDDSYSTYVDAISQLTSTLCGEIARALQILPQG